MSDKQSFVILCNEHPNSSITHVDINNYSSKKLLCNKCIKNNRLIDECDTVTFELFCESMKIVQDNFWSLSESKYTQEDINKVFNGICHDEKINKYSTEASQISNQYRVLIYSQIQESCDQFLKTMQEQIASFRQQLQENLKTMLQNYTQVKHNSPEQVKAANFIVESMENPQQNNIFNFLIQITQELEELIKQLHSGKLELKFIKEELNGIQAQIKDTLQELLDSQKKAFDSSTIAINLIIPQIKEQSNQSNIYGINSSRLTDSPLKSMRSAQLKQGNVFNSGSSIISNKQSESLSPQKISHESKNSLNSNNLIKGNQSNIPLCSKGQQQINASSQRPFFKDRFMNSLNSINFLFDRNSNQTRSTTSRENEQQQDGKIITLCKSSRDIQIQTISHLSSGENSDKSQTMNKISSLVELADKRIQQEDKKALIDSLYYKNNKSNDKLALKPNVSNKERPPSSDYKLHQVQQRNHQASQSLTSINSIKQNLSLKTQINLNVQPLPSPTKSPKANQSILSKSGSTSPASQITICQSKNNKDHINCGLYMNNKTLITGTQDGYLIVCDISAAQNFSEDISEINFLTKVKAHKGVTHLSQCPSNTSMFFSVGKFGENSSSIKLWTLGHNNSLTEVAELRDFHTSTIEEIHILQEDLTKDTASLNKNNKDTNSSPKHNEYEEVKKQQPLLTVITLVTLSKSDSLKIWKISYKNGSLQNGNISKQVEISLKGLNIKSNLCMIGNQFYLSNANKIFCYEFNSDFSSMLVEKKMDIFNEQSDYIQYMCASDNLLAVMSKKSQFVILSSDLKEKRNIQNYIQQINTSNKSLEIENISLSHLIPLQNDHFGIGYRYEKANQKVNIINGQTLKLKQVIDQFENSLSFVLGRNNNYNVILIESHKTIKIQKPWINPNKTAITFQK